MPKRDGLYLRGSIWWMRKDPITGREASTRCRDLSAARLVRAARERGAADPAHATSQAATVASECRRLFEARRSIGKPTLFHEQKLGHWARLVGDEFPINQVTPDVFDRFVAERRAEGVTDHTIGKEIGCMLTVLKLSKRAGVFRGDLAVLRPPWLPKGYVPRTRALTAPELLALLAVLTPPRQAFVALVVGLGLRRGELLALGPADVDLELGVVRVPGTKTAHARRTVPILEPFRKLVERASALLPLDGWARSRGNYLRDLKTACRHAGIEPVTANDLRRTHATLLRQAGVDKDVARRLLGHSPGSVLLEVVYDKPTAGQLAERAGDLTTLTRQFAALPEPSTHDLRRAREDSNLRPTAPEASPEEALPAGRARFPAEDDAAGALSPAPSTTETRHSAAAHALAMAAARVLLGRPRVHWVTVVRTEEAKGHAL